MTVVVLWARRVPTRVELRQLAPAGLLFGLSYVLLFEADWRRLLVVAGGAHVVGAGAGLIFGPLRARGYREIWLAGASMGGLGVVAYARTHPAKIRGVPGR